MHAHTLYTYTTNLQHYEQAYNVSQKWKHTCRSIIGLTNHNSKFHFKWALFLIQPHNNADCVQRVGLSTYVISVQVPTLVN